MLLGLAPVAVALRGNNAAGRNERTKTRRSVAVARWAAVRESVVQVRDSH